MVVEAPDIEVPKGSAKKGSKLFKAKCAQCHVIDSEGPQKSGPRLYQVMGRDAGTQAHYQYSADIRNSGIVWNDQHMHAFLTNPKAHVAGTKMVFAGIKKQSEMSDVIAYLHHISK